MEMANVVSQQPGSNRVSVRVAGTHGRVLKHVSAPNGVTLNADDRVLIARTGSESGWMVVTRVQTTEEYGIYVSTKAAKNALHPPDNFTVTPVGGGLLATWDCWPGSALAFEVQWTAVNDGEYDGSTYTYGGMYLYHQESQSKTWLRVRAIRYDMEEFQAFTSAWTSWEGDRPQIWEENLREQLDQDIALQEELLLERYETSAPSSGSYVLVSASAQLAQGRVLTETANEIVITDGGAGSTLTLSAGSLIVQTDQANTWTVGTQQIETGAAGTVGLVVKAAAGQSEKLTNWETSAGVALLSVQAAGHLQFAEAVNIVVGTTTGTQIGTAAAQKIGFFGATPVVQRATHLRTSRQSSTRFWQN